MHSVVPGAPTPTSLNQCVWTSRSPAPPLVPTRCPTAHPEIRSDWRLAPTHYSKYDQQKNPDYPLKTHKSFTMNIYVHIIEAYHEICLIIIWKWPRNSILKTCWHLLTIITFCAGYYLNCYQEWDKICSTLKNQLRSQWRKSIGLCSSSSMLNFILANLQNLYHDGWKSS